MKKDVTEECKIAICRYESSYKGFCGLELSHEGKSLLLIKLKEGDDGSTHCKLWGMNYGYTYELDDFGNFKIFYNSDDSKICPHCQRKFDKQQDDNTELLLRREELCQK